jgi:transcriptional regulator GlxA family with amidase domain
MNRALTYVRENLAETLREDILAEIAGLTPGGFSRAFKRHTGMTFVQYVNRLRINLACQLLMDKSLLIVNICYRVGFNNISNFNRHFLAEKGMTPSRFRELSERNRSLRPAA